MALHLVGGLISIIFTILLLPFRHLWLLVIVILAGILIYYSSHLPDDAPKLPGIEQLTSGGAPKPIRPERPRKEDGNSKFSTDILLMMSKPELTIYSHVFYWVMENVDPGKTHEWSNGMMKGKLTPGARFKNKSKATCRTFEEVLTVRHLTQTIRGQACENDDDGWCKLRPNSTPRCGLIRKQGGSWNNLFMDGKTDLQNLKQKLF